MWGTKNVPCAIIYTGAMNPNPVIRRCLEFAKSMAAIQDKTSLIQPPLEYQSTYQVANFPHPGEVTLYYCVNYFFPLENINPRHT